MVAKLKQEETSAKPSPVKMGNFVIDSVISKTAKIEPILATFTNGRPVKDGNLKGRLHQKHNGGSYKKPNRVFTVKTPWLNYYGKNFEEEDSPPIKDKESIFLGILDKNTGKMRLVETSSYTLHPKLHHIENKSLETPHEETYQEKQENIVGMFGSKRAMQRYKQRKLYDVNVEDMASAMKQASSSVKITEEYFNDSVFEENTYLTLLPPCDRQADSPEEVYKLEWIASDFFLCNFEETARKHVADEITFDETYSELMKEIIAIAKLDSDKENQVRFTCLALYIEQLIKFSYLARHKLKHDNEILSDCPHVVKKHILNEYTSSSGKVRTVTAVERDRLLCLILVLVLTGFKFEVFTSTLIKSLQIDLKKLHLLMKAVGATYQNNNCSFKLKFPLTTVAKSHKNLTRSLKPKSKK